MPRGKISAEGKARIAAAQRRRWAAIRAGKAPAPQRRGRKAKVESLNGNPYLQMTVTQLVTAKRQLDEAWRAAVTAMRRA
jgi:hypothetical protein